MLKGYGKVGARLDSRLPITFPILQRLLESSVRVCRTNYDSCLFEAMCSLALFACLRVGERTSAQTHGRGSLTQVHQLTQLVDETNRVVALKFTLLESKQNYNQHPFSLSITRRDHY